LNPDHIALIKERLGDAIVAFGYEDSNDW